jgi:hypothetical protein
MTSDGTRRKLSDLKVGESVLTVNRAGQLEFSPVILFLDRDPQESRQFYTIKTETGHSLTLTPTHLLYSRLAAASTSDLDVDFNEIEPDMAAFEAVYAKDVREGDFVLVQNGRGGLKPVRVFSIELDVLTGVYAPLTSAGNLVVDNVVASCYAVVDSQTLAHVAFAPLRWLSSIVWPASSEAVGIHWYANMLYSMGEVMMPSHLKP